MDLSTLEAHIHGVRFDIHLPDCQIVHLGHEGPVINWHIHNRSALSKILKRPQRELGQRYIKGEWDIDTRQIPTLLQTLIPKSPQRCRFSEHAAFRRLRAQLPHPQRLVPKTNWQDYNLWLSRLCLGDEVFLGCAEYSETGISMEQAQRLRFRHLIKLLQLEPEQHLLDLNAGWGSLPLYLAEHSGLRITALVSTREQLHHAHSEARRRGLDGSVHFRLGNFYQCRGRFDRVLASGFLERYPESTHRALFKRLETLLHEAGLAWLQVTGRSHTGGLSNQWHQQQLSCRYSLPLLSDLDRALDRTRLRALSMEDQSEYRRHDLASQIQRYHRKRAVISQRFGETRTRQWEFLLASEILAVQWGQLRQYEMILGNVHSRWPAVNREKLFGDAELPVEIVDKIPGLARDI